MGIDVNAHHVKNGHRTAPKSDNSYLKLLHKLYQFLARRTDANFNKVVLRRLSHSRVSRSPISLSKIVQLTQNPVAKKTSEGKTIAIVARVLDDTRLLEVPKLRICALGFAATARARIEKAGGECITWDTLALERPTGSNVMLLRGSKDREAIKHFGFGPNSHKKPYVGTEKGKRSERGRGRRRSKGFKV